ncbi:GMC oxidoreductase [Metarhizium rileyi]|uniref:GMC oxidoreductase n=1 Tax=Metarhizium rileyi (strain RCEF 4871) TaxID=1649241 RepID=A0A167CY96_METRR|nr:GMC oxidoreductase [Metarhizium rileyi RCEF 4871]
MPLSRGHVHINSADPFEFPVIMPRFLTDEFDQQVAIAVARISRQLWTSRPFDGYVDDAYHDPKIGPNGTDSEYLEWLRRTSGPSSHWIGATAMMPRELGGVVDSRLRVYGTQNLRVVDAGILPFQITAHMMSTLYAVAQKAAQLILEDCH